MLVHNGHQLENAEQEEEELSEGGCTRSPTKRAAGLKACPWYDTRAAEQHNAVD